MTAFFTNGIELLYIIFFNYRLVTIYKPPYLFIYIYSLLTTKTLCGYRRR